MKRDDFVSTKRLENAILRRRQNTNGEEINWLNICWIRVLKNNQNTLLYKTSFDENAKFRTLDLRFKIPQARKTTNI